MDELPYKQVIDELSAIVGKNENTHADAREIAFQLNKYEKTQLIGLCLVLFGQNFELKAEQRKKEND